MSSPYATSFRRAAALVLVLISIGAGAPATQPQGVEDAISALYAAVRAGDDAKTTKAALAVVAFGEPAVSRIAASIADKGPQEIVWALRCVREIGSPQGTEVAASVAAHANPGVRAEAVWTAHQIGHEGAMPVLLRAATDPDDVVRRRAFDGILAYGPTAPGSMEAALKGVLDPDTWVMLDAFQILNDQPLSAEEARDKDKVVVAIGRMIPQLDDRNAAGAIDLVVRRAGIQSASVLDTALDSRKSYVAIAALQGVGKLRLGSALSRVHSLARGSDTAISKAAIEAIAQVNDAKSLPLLVDLLAASRDAAKTDALAVALRVMTGRLYGTDVELWRKYLNAR